MNGMPMPMMGRSAPGPTGPATTAPQNEGLRTRGMVLAAVTIKMLTEVVRLLGATTEEGRDALKALSTLSKRFGQASGDLSRQEAKLITERAAPVGQPGPQQAAAWQQMVKSRLGGMGLPASAAPAPVAAGAGAVPPARPESP